MQAATAQAAGPEPGRAGQRGRRRQHDGRHRHGQHARRASSPPASARAARSTPARTSRWWIPQGEIAAFCDSTNRWLPLLCTMNVTVATEMVRQDFGMDARSSSSQGRAKAPAGCGRPAAAALSRRRAHAQRARRHRRVARRQHRAPSRAQHFARAAMEGVTLGMNYGLRRLAELGVKPQADPRHRRRREIQSSGGRSWRTFSTPKS